MAKILLVEDDEALSFSAAGWLRRQKHLVEEQSNGQLALEFALSVSYDLLILDWELPGLSGAEICNRYRASGGKSPIIFVTGRTSIKDKQTCFDAGADDFISKPFAMEELVMRVTALLRRPPSYVDEKAKIGCITLDRTRLALVVGETAIELRPKEYQIVELLLKNPEQVFSPETIVSRLWPTDADATVFNLRPQIARLRKKFEDLGIELIRTVRGTGYALNLDAINNANIRANKLDQ